MIVMLFIYRHKSPIQRIFIERILEKFVLIQKYKTDTACYLTLQIRGVRKVFLVLVRRQEDNILFQFMNEGQKLC